MNELNEKQKQLLKKIVNDKFSIGAFSGMIFNKKFEAPALEIEELVIVALNIRLTLEEMAEDKVPELPLN